MKRFTETLKWSDPWFRKLDPKLKLLWFWIVDNCDHAGVIDLDLEMASFHIGYEYPLDTLSDTLLKFDGRVEKLECGKYRVVKFIPFQFGELSADCKAHRPIFQSLEKHQIKGYGKGIHSHKDKRKDKDKEKDVTDFEKFWECYPRKVGKQDALKAFDRASPSIEIVISAIEAQKKSDQWTKNGGQFIPHPATWINRGSWEDQVQTEHEQPVKKPKAVAY